MKNKSKRNTIVSVALVMSLICTSNASYLAVVKAENVLPIPIQQELESVTDISEYESNEIIVQYKEGALSTSKEAENATAITEDYSLIEVDNKVELKEMIQELEEDPNVDYIQPNYTYASNGVSNDYYTEHQWAYHNEGLYSFGDIDETAGIDINLTQAWGMFLVKPEKEVIVAVVDTGIDYDHKDLISNMWVNTKEIPGNGIDDDKNGYKDDTNGWNFYNNSKNICNDRLTYDKKYDSYGTEEDHGTHVAGIIAATSDNGEGVAGIASKANVKIMSAKALGGVEGTSIGYGTTDSVTQAIKYAEKMGADICNLSLGGPSYDPIMEAAIRESKMLFVIAAGNGAYISSLDDYMGYSIDNSAEYPASYESDNIITVANLRCDGNLDTSSNYGKASVDIAAPGALIVSTVVEVLDKTNRPDPYDFYSGTSMAAPMVSGVAALVAAYHTDISNSQIKKAIMNSSQKLGSLTNKVGSGGMLDAYAALNYDISAPIIATLQEAIDNSNSKNLLVTVTRPEGEIAKVVYAAGTKTTDYFEKGNKGTQILLENNTGIVMITKNGNYTIYALDTLGNETIHVEKVDVLSVTKVKLAVTKKTILKGKSYTIKSTLYPEAVISEVTYKSSNKKVATVSDQGKITAKGKGTAQITVTASNGKKAVCKITVK